MSISTALTRSDEGSESTSSRGHRPSLRTWLHYRVDAVFSRGSTAILLWILLLTVLLVALTAVLLLVLGVSDPTAQTDGLADTIWAGLVHVLDPGSIAEPETWTLRLIVLGVSAAGIVLVSTLIGTITAAIDGRLAELRKGRSQVLEQHHIVILGWAPRVFTLLSELVQAYEDEAAELVVAVLAPMDRTAMEDAIEAHLGDLGGNRVLCRRGDPGLATDRRLVNIDRARSIVVLAEAGREGDAQVVRTVIGIRHEHQLPPSVPLVAELSDEVTTAAVMDLLGDGIVAVRSTEVIAMVTAQACRLPGLSYVFQELLTYEGTEIYLQDVPEVRGLTFAEAVLSFANASVIGIRHASGTVEVCPPFETRIGAGDQIVAVCESLEELHFTGRTVEVPSLDQALGGPTLPRERLLVVGWSDLAVRLLRGLDSFVAEGTVVDVLIDERDTDVPDLSSEHLAHLTTRFERGVVDADALVAASRRCDYDTIIVLGYRSGITKSEADARTLLNVLLLQQAASGFEHRPRIVAEVLDPDNVPLARAAGADDFVVSDVLGALMMGQYALQPDRKAVFDDLFVIEGSSIHLREVTDLGLADRELTMGEVTAEAMRAGDLVIGYRHHADGDGHIVMNACKDDLVRFGPQDHLVVVCRALRA